MARFITHLTGLQHPGSPLVFPISPNPHALPKSIIIENWWPTFLIGGERPGGYEFGYEGTQNE